MYLYNVTYKVETLAEEMWLNWMRLVHIPKVVKTGSFLGHRICKLMGMDESDGITYAIQYMVPDIETFKTFQAQYSADLKQELTRKFPNQLVSFNTILKILE